MMGIEGLEVHQDSLELGEDRLHSVSEFLEVVFVVDRTQDHADIQSVCLGTVLGFVALRRLNRFEILGRVKTFSWWHGEGDKGDLNIIFSVGIFRKSIRVCLVFGVRVIDG
jgi:hypothetical protein